MGCKPAKDKEATRAEAPPKEASKMTAEEQCQELAYLVCDAYWEHLTSESGPGACPPQIRRVTWESFLNTLTDTFAIHLRLSFESARDNILLGAKRVTAVPPEVGQNIAIVPRQIDICLGKFMDAWINATWPNVAAHVPYPLAVEISRELAFPLGHVDHASKRDVTLVELFDGLFWNVKSAELTDLFHQISHNADELSIDDMAFFYKSQGVPEFNESQAAEKLKVRFGGHLTARSFASYFGNSLLNSALDLQRSTVVWQDMTKPLPSYLVMTCTVETERDLAAAVLHGARAFILNVYPRPHPSQPGKNQLMLSDDYDLERCLTAINHKAFQHNPFPVVLMLNPECDFPIALQTEVAEVLVRIFQDRLPKGLMFEGATLSDPLFSPAALKEKVLIMAKQAPLKPFVGLMVADMQREGLGVRVTDVKDSTPAAKAGIHKDDWLTHINGSAIHDKKNMKLQLAQLRLGDMCIVRKENLDEVKLVVGGAVNGGAAAANCSEALSDVVFLRMEDLAHQGSFAPWETQTIAANESISPSQDHFLRTPCKRASRVQNATGRPATTIDTADLKHSESMKTPEPNLAGALGREHDISKFDAAGVHFIDVRISRAAWLWAIGKFADNGHCGYLLSDSSSNPGSPTVPPSTIDITLSCAPVCCKGMPLVRFSGHVLGGEVIMANMKGPSSAHPTVSIEVKHRRSVVVLEFCYGNDEKTMRQFVAAMPAHLMRPGYHAVTLLDAHIHADSLDDDRSTVAMCFVQRA